MNSDRWLVADEWFASFIRDLESHAGRVVRLKREAGCGIPKHHRAAVEYEQQTENYLRFLRHESRNTWSESVEPHAPTDAPQTTNTKQPEPASTNTVADASPASKDAASTS